jgi:hypothetical protein
MTAPLRRTRIALALAATASIGIGATLAWACADSSCDPTWRLDAPTYACDGRAMLAPGNDTRINLLLLMRSLVPIDDSKVAYGKPDWDDDKLGHVFVSWKGLRATLWPEPAEADTGSAAAPACSAPQEAQDAFAAALAADKRVSADDRATLTSLRAKSGCEGGDASPSVGAPARDYLAYLQAADAFHRSQWDKARTGFAALTRSASPWIAETAGYMPVRIGLRAAVAGSMDQYGDFAGLDKVDTAAARAAGTAIDAYLAAYPKGRYAVSAEGLRRRVWWLTQQTGSLAARYEAMLRATSATSAAAADLAEEIDVRLFEAEGGAGKVLAAGQDLPLLSAIADLKQMRQVEAGKPLPLTAAMVEAQAARFSAMPELYGLVAASRAYYAGEAPRTILPLLPDAARQPAYSPLAFSRQVLRGMALGRAHDANEAGFWRELASGARGAWQRPLVELGLALRWQRDGQLAQAFAPGSPIGDTTLRQLMLQTMASPAILRASAADATRPADERNVAGFTLLFKGLTRGAYADVARDLALVPPGKADADAWYGVGLATPPAARFTAGKWSDGFACPPLAQTVATLARAPMDQAARLCLGDFYRLNGFDGFTLYRPQTDPDMGGAANQLGSGPDLYPGKPVSRDTFYAAIIADKAAAADLRAYALYRMIQCYAPSGHNTCAWPSANYEAWLAADAPKAQRKAWYDELKARYPTSRWAKALRYYW